MSTHPSGPSGRIPKFVEGKRRTGTPRNANVYDMKDYIVGSAVNLVNHRIWAKQIQLMGVCFTMFISSIKVTSTAPENVWFPLVFSFSQSIQMSFANLIHLEVRCVRTGRWSGRGASDQEGAVPVGMEKTYTCVEPRSYKRSFPNVARGFSMDIPLTTTGCWWFGTFYMCPFSWEESSKLTKSYFFRGVGIPPTRLRFSNPRKDAEKWFQDGSSIGWGSNYLGAVEATCMDITSEINPWDITLITMVIIGYIVYIHIILIWLYIFCIYIFYGYNPYNYGYTLKTRTALTSIQYVYGLLPEPTHVFMSPTEGWVN